MANIAWLSIQPYKEKDIQVWGLIFKLTVLTNYLTQIIVPFPA